MTSVGFVVVAVAVLGSVSLSSAFPLFPGPDKWDEIPDSHYQVLYDREMVITEPRGQAKAVIFALHGCLQSVVQWGFKSSTCPVCDGMPEEMVTVYNAVKRGYAVVAMGPHRVGDVYACFNTTWPPKGYYELPQMTQNIRHILKQKKWWDLPRYALGSSRGGEMALSLALRFPLQGVASIVMGLRNETLETDLVPINENTNETFPYPPVLFMKARNDQMEVQEALAITIPTMEDKGIYVEEFMMEPYPITPTFFSQRLRGVDDSLSEMLFTRLQTKGILDEEGWSQFSNWTDAKEGGWELAQWEMEVALHHFFWPEWKRGNYDRAFKEMLWSSEAIHEQNAQYIDYVLDFFERTTTPEVSFLNGTKLNETHPWVAASDEYDIMLKDKDDDETAEKKKNMKPWNWWGAIEDPSATPDTAGSPSGSPSAKPSSKASAAAAEVAPGVATNAKALAHGSHGQDAPAHVGSAKGSKPLVSGAATKPTSKDGEAADGAAPGKGGADVAAHATGNADVAAHVRAGADVGDDSRAATATDSGWDAEGAEGGESRHPVAHHHHHVHKDARQMKEHVPVHHHAKGFANGARLHKKRARRDN